MDRSFWYALVANAVLAFCVSNTSTAAAQSAPKAPGASNKDSWTGFYAGGHAGYGMSGDQTLSRSDTLEHVQAFGPAFLKPVSLNESDSSALAGVQIGYNWQFSPQWLIGVEADWSWAGIEPAGSFGPLVEFDGAIADGSSASLSTDIRGLGSVRGRLGYAQPTWMAYVTGGWAMADIQFNGDIYCPTGICAGSADTHGPVSFSRNRSGWVLGGGAEFKRADSPWVLGLEYLHYGFDSTDSADSALVTTANGTPVAAGSCVAGERCLHYAFGGIFVDAISARLTYKFD
jgi:outer membrane immunogenic protein